MPVQNKSGNLLKAQHMYEIDLFKNSYSLEPCAKKNKQKQIKK